MTVKTGTTWRVTARDRWGHIEAYESRDGRWLLTSQPFTPVWHVNEYDSATDLFVFVVDFPRVSAAKDYAERHGAT